MLLLIILNILNLVGVRISLNSDRSELQKDNYRSKEVTNVGRYIHKSSNRFETVNKYAISYSGQYVNENIVHNVKTNINSFYMDTPHIKHDRNGEKHLNRDVKTGLKQNVNINVNYNTNTDWYDITPLNKYNMDTISNVNTDNNLKINSVQKVIGLTKIASVNQNMDLNQNLTEFFNRALISDHTNSGQYIKEYLDEDTTDDVNKILNSDQEHWDSDGTEYESKSNEEQDLILYEISDCDVNLNHKNLGNSDSKNVDKEEEEPDDFDHDFVEEEEKIRETDNAQIFMNIKWSPLVTQEKRVHKYHKRKGRRKPNSWEKYFSNYHENIGIPSAQKIKAQESDAKSRLRSSTRIVNGTTAEIGEFPYLVRFIR